VSRVEMWHGQRIYHAFPQIFDNLAQSANVVEGHGYFVWRNNFHGDVLLILVEWNILPPRSAIVFPPDLSLFAILVLAIVLALVSVVVGEYGLQAIARGGGFLFRFGFGAGVWVESGDDVLGCVDCSGCLREL